MNKYPYEFRLNAVKLALDGKHSMNSAAKELNLSHNQLREWVQHYQKLGTDGLYIHNGTYTGNFKFQVLQVMETQHLSAYQVAIEFNIPHARTVSKWMKLFKEEGIDALYRDNRGNSKHKKLQNQSTNHYKTEYNSEEILLNRIAHLEMENDFLKKKIEWSQKLGNKSKKLSSKQSLN